MRTEQSFILPRRDNEGKSLQELHRAVRISLIRVFGGFTYESVNGVWASEGKEYDDESVRYHVAADWSVLDWTQLVRGFCIQARQECVYTKLNNGEVRFIDQEGDSV